jgi:hypothetical protein
MERPTCGTCPYFEASVTKLGYGWCYRYAPRPLVVPETDGPVPSNAMARWPETGDEDWCGEHPELGTYLVARRLDRRGEGA